MKHTAVCAMCLLLLACSVLPLFFACGSGTKCEQSYFDLFDTVITVTHYGNPNDFSEVCERIYNELAIYHNLYDIYTPPVDGEVTLYTVNAEAGRAPIVVDARIFDLLTFAVNHTATTENMVQITYGAVLSLWHTARETGVLPTDAALAAAAKHTNPADLILDAETQTVFFADPLLRLDVGAVAKGYAVARVVETLTAAGVSGYLINAGGMVTAIGQKSDYEMWDVGVTNPADGTLLGYVHPNNQTIATSADTYRTLIADGVSYSHIIDPTTGKPAARYAGVSVYAATADLADLLSTALFLLPEETGREMLARYGAQAVWIYPDGSVVATENFIMQEN